jgi:hypothetical protein
MVYFQTKKIPIWVILEGLGLEHVDIFYGHLAIFYGLLGYDIL